MSETYRPERARAWFLTLCAAAVALAVGYIAWTRQANSDTASPEAVATLAEIQARPYVIFRDTSLGASHGRLVFKSLDSPSRRSTDLSCERVDFANGYGVCLRAERGFATVYDAVVFDAALTPRHSLALAGVPSRVRISPDGQRAGITVFVSGDSYAPGNFSTRTTVLDTASGKNLGDFEQFAVIRDGAPFKAVDFNFWGLTFATKNTVYATLGTGGRTYLVKADVDAKSAQVVHEGVECPALSPDGSRVAFKKRIDAGGRLHWRLHVLNLQTGAETTLSEARSVDDQAEWLDPATVTYALPSESKAGSTDVWSVAADGSGTPRRILAEAWSPAFINPSQGHVY